MHRNSDLGGVVCGTLQGGVVWCCTSSRLPCCECLPSRKFWYTAESEEGSPSRKYCYGPQMQFLPFVNKGDYTSFVAFFLSIALEIRQRGWWSATTLRFLLSLWFVFCFLHASFHALFMFRFFLSFFMLSHSQSPNSHSPTRCV